MVEGKTFAFKTRVILIYVIVLFMAFITFYPMWYTLCISFSSSIAVQANRVTVWPVEWTTVAYTQGLSDSQFWRSTMITVFVTVFSVIFQLFFTVTMAWPLSKENHEFRGRRIYMGILIFAMLFNGGLIPNYMLIKNLGLLNNIWSLIIPGCVPIGNVILMMNFMRSLPKSLEEAAIIDGASWVQILLRVILPCSTASLATITLFIVIGSWNAYFGGLIYMTKTKDYPLMTYIYSLHISIEEMVESGVEGEQLIKAMQLSSNNFNAAKIFLATLPLIVLYPALQKYFITGLVVGSVKE